MKNKVGRNFGNARFVRNIYEKTVIKHASNVKDKKQKKKHLFAPFVTAVCL